jgi:hypothetical protein
LWAPLTLPLLAVLASMVLLFRPLIMELLLLLEP